VPLLLWLQGPETLLILIEFTTRVSTLKNTLHLQLQNTEGKSSKHEEGGGGQTGGRENPKAAVAWLKGAVELLAQWVLLLLGLPLPARERGKRQTS